MYNTTLYKKHIKAFAFLIFILLGAGWIRVQGIPQIPEGQFTSLDAYSYYWQAGIIAEQGRLPERDMHRWLPLGRDLEQTLPFYAYVLVYVHKATVLFFPNVSLYKVAIFAPMVCFVLGMAALSLFLYRVFGFSIAVIVLLFLALMPGSVDRSSAGFSDRDSWCLLLGILTITTYLWKEQIQRPHHRFFFTTLSGFFAFLGGLSWEGFGIFILIILCAELWRFLTSEREERFTEYLLWVFMFVPWLYLISPAYRRGEGFSTYLAALVLFPPLIVLGIRSLRHFLTNHKSFSKFIHGRVSRRTVALILTIGCFVLGISYVFSQQDSLAQHIVPLSNHRLMQTVGELDAPEDKNWQFRYGGVVLLGSLGLIAGCVRIWGKKGIPLALMFWIFTMSTFFRDSLYQLLSPTICEFLFRFSVGLIPVIVLGIARLRKIPVKNEITYIVLSVWFFLWVGLARGWERYDFFVGVPIAFFSAMVIRSVSTFTVEKWKTFDVIQTMLKTGISIAVLTILLFWVPPGSTTTDFLAKRGFFTPTKMRWAIPGKYTSHGIAMENALNWMKEKHSKKRNMVIAAEWSYGSILNVLGGAKTIVDQDHFIPHWIHLYSRHVFCAQSEREALEYLKTHEVTHLLLTELDVRRPQRTSFVGSNEKHDRQFDFVVMRSIPSDSGSTYKITPSVENTPIKLIDIDFVSPISAVARLKTGKDVDLPYVILFGQGNVERNFNTENANGGIVHFFHSNPQHNKIYYVPSIGWNSLAVRLFFSGLKSPHFVPEYPQKEFSTAKVKIWKIHYPPNIIKNPKYLATAHKE